MRQLIGFIKKDFLIEKHYRLHFITKIFGILFQLTIFYFFSKLVSEDFFPFLFLGILFSKTFNFALSNLTETIRQEQYWQTLEPLFLSGIKPLKLTILFFVSKFIFFLIELLIFMIFGYMFFKINFGFTKFILIIFILLINLICFCGIGFFSAGFVMMFKRGDPVNWFLSNLVDLLSGVYFPVVILPDWLCNISYILPTTYGLKFLRDTVLNEPFESVNVYILIFTGIIVAIFGYMFFRYTIYFCLKKGSLSHY